MSKDNSAAFGDDGGCLKPRCGAFRGILLGAPVAEQGLTARQDRADPSQHSDSGCSPIDTDEIRGPDNPSALEESSDSTTPQHQLALPSQDLSLGQGPPGHEPGMNDDGLPHSQNQWMFTQPRQQDISVRCSKHRVESVFLSSLSTGRPGQEVKVMISEYHPEAVTQPHRPSENFQSPRAFVGKITYLNQAILVGVKCDAFEQPLEGCKTTVHVSNDPSCHPFLWSHACGEPYTPDMSERVAVVIPSLGAPSLRGCLASLAHQNLRPNDIILVLSGGSKPPEVGPEVTIVLNERRLGFAAAVNRGLKAAPTDTDFIALLNDDAEPSPQWLNTLVSVLKNHDEPAAVQGTVIDANDPPRVDGRGLAFDRLGLPIQVERGAPTSDGERGIEDRLGVSATAALFRSTSLNSVKLQDGSLFDESFDCYHEDTDLALRMVRLGLRSAWVPGASCLHIGSASSGQQSWRHPRWILANRWRALAGNLSPLAFGLAFPRLFLGEIRAVRTLARRNPRAIPVAALVFASLPLIKVRGWLRSTPGPRLKCLPDNFEPRPQG